MLSKENRLKRKKDFEKIFQKGKSFKQDLLFLKVLENDLGFSRFGFIVSRKISKKAVLRNKVKRRLREGVRTKSKEIKKGIDIVLIALPGLEKKDFWEMKKTLDQLFKKARIIR